MQSEKERIDEGVLWWFGHVEKIAKRVFVGECVGSCSVGRPRKRWIDTWNKFLKKRGLDISQERRIFQDRSEWWDL